MSEDFQTEIKFLGIEPSPAFVRQPEGNGCFFRTLKEQLLWIRRFKDVAELHEALTAFRDRYNNHWILGRPPFGNYVLRVRFFIPAQRFPTFAWSFVKCP